MNKQSKKGQTKNLRRPFGVAGNQINFFVMSNELEKSIFHNLGSYLPVGYNSR
jgi:hypothetical protein